MPDLFREIWADAQSAFDEVFGEEFVLVPRTRSTTDPDARTSADDARPSITFVGAYTSEADMAQAQGRGRSGDWTREYVGHPAFIKVATLSVPGFLAAGDEIHRVSSAEKFTVTRILPDDLNTQKIYLRVK